MKDVEKRPGDAEGSSGVSGQAKPAAAARSPGARCESAPEEPPGRTPFKQAGKSADGLGPKTRSKPKAPGKSAGAASARSAELPLNLQRKPRTESRAEEAGLAGDGRKNAEPPAPRRGRPFQKGQSGNPAGKPKGTRNRTTVIAQGLIDNEAEALVRKVVEMALNGDLACLRICLERLVPTKRDAPIEIALPRIGSTADIPKLLEAVTAKIGAGGITPAEAKTIMDLAETFRKALEAAELERRIGALEEAARK